MRVKAANFKLKRFFLLIAACATEVLVGMGLPAEAMAQSGLAQYSSLTRLSLTAGGMAPTAGGPGQPSGAVAGALADFGFGRLTFEAGVQYLAMQTGVRVSDPNSAYGVNPMNYAFANLAPASPSQIATTVNLQYVGLPLYAKYNYIESPMATFSLKLGAMPAILVNEQRQEAFSDAVSGGSVTLQTPKNELFGVAGFTGTAPIGDWDTAFVLDGSYIYGLNAIDAYQTHQQGFLLTAGFRLNL